MRSESRASLAGIALALRTLRALLGRMIEPREIVFAQGEKPRLAAPGALASGESLAACTRGTRCDEASADFSIAHAGPWAACAALRSGRIGLDIEMGTEPRIADWVVREAALKASGEGLRAFTEVKDLAMHAHRLHWRGEAWHVRRLGGFAGACACLVSTLELHEVETHKIELAELFGS